MDIEELRKRWKRIDIESPDLRKENRELRRRLSRSNIKGLNVKLYRRMLVSAIACAVAPTLLIGCSEVMSLREVTVYAYILFFLIMCALYGYLAWRLSDTSYLSQPVLQASREIARREITMRRMKIAGRLMGIPVLVLLFIDMYNAGGADGENLIVGGVIGGIIGGFFGWRIERSNLRIIRRIKSTLQQMEQENLPEE